MKKDKNRKPSSRRIKPCASALAEAHLLKHSPPVTVDTWLAMMWDDCGKEGPSADRWHNYLRQTYKMPKNWSPPSGDNPKSPYEHLVGMVMAIEECCFAGTMPLIMSLARALWSNFDTGQPSEEAISRRIRRHRKTLQAVYDKLTSLQRIQ